MAVAHETFQHLATAGLAEVDPQIADLLARARTAARPDRADRVGELHLAVRARGGRLRSDEQVRRGLSRQALLRRLRGRRRDRADWRSTGPRSSSAPSTRTSSRTRARRRTWRCTWPRCKPGTRCSRSSSPRRPPHARAEGQLLRPAVHDRALRRVARDERRRLRRGAAPRQGGTAEADRLRRLRVPAHGRHRRFRKIADEVGALLLCDMAHFAGLVAAGLHPNPVADCDFVTSTTHKTLAGPRSGFILCKEEHAQAVDRAVFPGMQGGPLSTRSRRRRRASRSRRPTRSATTSARCARTRTCSPTTLIDGGLDVLTGGTDTHLLQLDLRSTEWTGKDAEERLHEVKLTANRNTVPFDERPPTVASGVRIGTPAATMRGFDEDDFREVGRSWPARSRGRRPRRAARAQRGAVREAAAVPGFRGYTTYAGDGTVETERRVDPRHASARPAQALVPARPHTPTVHFRKLVEEVTLLLTYEATKDFPTEQVEIETPLERTTVAAHLRQEGRRLPGPARRASGCSTACSR